MDILSTNVIAEKIFPRSRVAEFSPYWKEVFQYAEINTPKRLAMFLAQTGHESQGYVRFTENLNYRTPRLIEVWPSRFRMRRESDKSGAVRFSDGKYDASKFSGSPVALANIVYANRMGNLEPGDGWKYHGRGPIMATGKENYEKFTRDTYKILGRSFVEEPELLATPRYGLWFAGWFWKTRGINTPSDIGSVRQSTLLINGGVIGLSERTKLYNRILTEIS